MHKALEEDLHPIKVNTVLIKGFNDDEILIFVTGHKPPTPYSLYRIYAHWEGRVLGAEPHSQE